ncbi:MAG: hypothetical protein WBA31_08470 [Candidatus Dormiibacterota bacterium]
MSDLPVRRPDGWLSACCDAVMCSPPALVSESRTTEIVDRILPKGAWRCVFFVAVAMGVGGPNLLVGAVTTLAASTYCILNFWRCREAHCIVSGIGWAALATFEFVEVGYGRSLIRGSESLAFLVILGLAISFEVFWHVRHGTNAVSLSVSPRRR